MQRRIAHLPLPLHGDRAPAWLFQRMHKLAGSILTEVSDGPTLFMPRHHEVRPLDIDARRLDRIMKTVQEREPADFEGLLGLPGVGPKTVRSLALIAELVYGAPVCRRDLTRCWTPRDPATFSYAHGGKDGHPFPVDRPTYDRSIALLEGAVRRARIDPAGRDQALYRLARWVGSEPPSPSV